MPTLQSALTDAAVNGGPDTVRVAAGTFQPTNCASNGFTYNSPDSLTLVGAGASTILTCPASSTNFILALTGPVMVSDLHVHIPSGLGGRGVFLFGGASASDLTVTSDPAGGGVVPVRIVGGSLQHSLIGAPLADNFEAVLASAGALLNDDSINGGGVGVDADGNPDVTITHSKIAARRCHRTVVLGSFRHRDVAGTNRVSFSGRLGRRLLAPGRYSLGAVARLAGVASRPVSATFTVIA